MKTYKYINAHGQTVTITGSNKYQEIHYNADGVPFVRFRNLRIKLDAVMRYHDIDVSRVIGCEICGVYNDTVYSVYLIHISNNGDQAKVFYASYC
jgi:hypothetical protein